MTAWSSGHYNGWAAVSLATNRSSSPSPAIIRPTTLSTTGLNKTAWKARRRCGSCHPSFKEWQADGHSQSATQLSLSLPCMPAPMWMATRAAPKKTNLGIPLAPEPDDDDYHGPGFKLDFPNNPGKCATCHTPMAAKIGNMQTCGWSGCHKDGTAAYAGPASWTRA